MFEEVDYLREGYNAERFANLFGIRTPSSNPLSSFSGTLHL